MSFNTLLPSTRRGYIRKYGSETDARSAALRDMEDFEGHDPYDDELGAIYEDLPPRP